MALLDGDNGMGHLVMQRRRDRHRQGARRRHRLGRRAAQQPRRAGLAVCAHGAAARHDRPLFRGRQRQPPAALGRPRHAAVDQPDRGRRCRPGRSRRWCSTWRPRSPPTARSRPRRSAASHARGLDDRPAGPAADRPEARRRGLPAADRRLQGLRPGADRRPAGRHARTAPRWAAR